MNHFIAQTVYALRDHITGAFKKGDERMIYDRIPPACKCGIELVAIGIRKRTREGIQHCGRCRESFFTPGPYAFYHASSFISALEVDRAVEELLNTTEA